MPEVLPAGTPPAPSNNPDVARGAVSLAFAVGWRLAELYDQDELPSPRPPDPAAPPPPHLPGASEMSQYDRARVILGQAQAAVVALASVLGVELPSLDGVGAVLDRDGHHRDDVRREILSSFMSIRNRLAEVSPLASTSCGLGRMLADTARLPSSNHPEILLERFESYRLSNAYRWLDDLSTALPAESAAAVKASLATWAQWAAKCPRVNGKLAPGALDGVVIRRLREQGEMWRRLMAGEVVARTLLGPEDYVSAAERLMQRGRQIAAHFLAKWWLAVAAIVVGTGLAIWAALTYAPAGSTRTAAVLVSLAGALGVSWKTVGATLGKALSQAEASLWDSEIVVAIGHAATIQPTSGKGGIADDSSEGQAGPPKDTHALVADSSSASQRLQANGEV